MRTKPEFERAIKRSISMPASLFRHAEREARERGYSTFSHYLQDLIRKQMHSQAQQHA